MIHASCCRRAIQTKAQSPKVKPVITVKIVSFKKVYKCLVYYLTYLGVMVHPLGDYACQPSDSSVIAHSLTAFYYINGAAYTNGQTQTIANSCAKVHKLHFLTPTARLLTFFIRKFNPSLALHLCV